MTTYRSWFQILLAGFVLVLLQLSVAFAQTDQGAITGVVQDSSGAVVPGASVTLTATDTQFTLKTKTDGSGIFVFSPVKIGRYHLSASATGFQTTVQENLQLNIQERLNVNFSLRPGAITETVTVTAAPPVVQSQSASVGQEMSTQTINNTPLNQRNWVYIAQLAAGVVPSNGTRGGGSGDFEADGQRAEQNNFMLDGVDNNVNIVDYMNGSMYAIAPPPDALSEFKLETADFSAEYGHSAGAVLNATVKSGTNNIHGDVWEYLRNTNLNAKDWNALVIPPYHMNQFGGTLGLPIVKNKLFYFGDIQNTRISYAATTTVTVPTPLMRQGNFSEILNTSLTGQARAIQLYQPNSGGTTPLTCAGQNNAFCASQINPVAQRLLNLYPLPNTNGGKTFNNLVENLTTHSDPVQWDQRLDWNATAKDQAYARFSYQHIINLNTAPLGPILDGTTSFAGQHQNYRAENFMLSESHLFNANLINEFRFGYNWGTFANLQANSDVNVAAALGLGGMPFGPGYPQNGGLPSITVGSITAFGTHGNDPSVEVQNTYQILDNITRIVGNHSLKAGVNIQKIRVYFLQPPAPRGNYGYSGLYTSIPGQSFTGYGVADFLANQMNSASITNEPVINNEQGYTAAYFEDHWRVTPKLTVQLGLRYDYFQPYKEMAGYQANFVPLAGTIGTGVATYLIPSVSRNANLPAAFLALLQKDHVNIQYDDNSRLATEQKTAFSPRIGLAYQVDPRTVVRAGFGMFYGAIQSAGSNANIGENFPFVLRGNLVTPSCTAMNPCQSLSAQGATLENGLTNQLAQGIQNFVSSPSLFGTDPKIKTPYTGSFNFFVQHAFSDNLTASVGYVGNFSRHLITLVSPNGAYALITAGLNSQSVSPFPDFSGGNYLTYAGNSSYHSLQATLQKRFAKGLSFLSTFTWSHALDDSTDPLGGGVGYRATNLIPIKDEYTNSNYDSRLRYTFNGNYELPFGHGRAHLGQSRVLDVIAGGWSASLTFISQTGTPFTVGPNISTASGSGSRAISIESPFTAGGSPNATNPTITCAQHVHTLANWYNPCAFMNPLPGNTIPVGTRVTNYGQIIAFTGGLSNTVYGPGYERTNMSMFKNFTMWREQYLQFRADVFNIMNHPSWGNPSTTNINSTGGTITGPKSFQSNTPDSRFFQLSLKYVF